jgi:hypothetical protein
MSFQEVMNYWSSFDEETGNGEHYPSVLQTSLKCSDYTSENQ